MVVGGLWARSEGVEWEGKLCADQVSIGGGKRLTRWEWRRAGDRTAILMPMLMLMRAQAAAAGSRPSQARKTAFSSSLALVVQRAPVSCASEEAVRGSWKVVAEQGERLDACMRARAPVSGNGRQKMVGGRVKGRPEEDEMEGGCD